MINKKYPALSSIIEADMAFNKDKALKALDAFQFRIAIHLILMFSFPASDETRGWLKELNAWRKTLARKSHGKKGARNLKHKILLNGIWEEPLGEPGDRAYRIKEIHEEKGILVPSLEPRLKDFRKFVELYISAIESDVPFDLGGQA